MNKKYSLLAAICLSLGITFCNFSNSAEASDLNIDPQVTNAVIESTNDLSETSSIENIVENLATNRRFDKYPPPPPPPPPPHHRDKDRYRYGPPPPPPPHHRDRDRDRYGPPPPPPPHGWNTRPRW